MMVLVTGERARTRSPVCARAVARARPPAHSLKSQPLWFLVPLSGACSPGVGWPNRGYRTFEGRLNRLSASIDLPA